MFASSFYLFFNTCFSFLNLIDDFSNNYCETKNSKLFFTCKINYFCIVIFITNNKYCFIKQFIKQL